MTADTIQKIADDLEGFILLSDQQRKTLVDRLRALSARASAGEGGEDYRTHHNDFRVACLVAQTHATSDADRRYWQHQVNVLDRIKAAAPQPAQAGASGGGEVEIAEIMRGCLSAIEGGRDPRYGFSIGPSIEGIEEAAKRIAAMLATPASPATGDAATWEEEIRRHDATPPAHGDGEVVDHAARWMRLLRDATNQEHEIAMLDAILAALTTRPTPEAQEARDAARYRLLRDRSVDDYGSCRIAFTWSCPIQRVEGHDPVDNAKFALDAAIDAALALPAQGEGNNG